jgi:hypothetical protein
LDVPACHLHHLYLHRLPSSESLRMVCLSLASTSFEPRHTYTGGPSTCARRFPGTWSHFGRQGPIPWNRPVHVCHFQSFSADFWVLYLGFSFVVAVWITGPRFSLAKNFFRHAAPPEPDPQDLSIWDLASLFGLTERPKFPTKRSKRLKHSQCPCGHIFLNIAGYTTTTLFTQVFISQETRGRSAYIYNACKLGVITKGRTAISRSA